MKEEVLKELSRFSKGKEFYYIHPKGKIDSFIIHSGMSPIGAYQLSKSFVLYDNFTDANLALELLKNNFTFWNEEKENK